MIKDKRFILGFSIITVVVLVVLALNVPSILAAPLITPSAYLSQKPYIDLGGLIIMVPSSSVFIFGLGIFTIFIGGRFLKDKQFLQDYYGVALVFWGVGALLAGMSYQSFGYELKCATNEYCLFTSWFELAYYYFTAISIAVLSDAVIKTIRPHQDNKWFNLYFYAMFVVYVIILVIGSVFEIQLFITYELFTVFFMPMFVLLFVVSVIYYRRNKDLLNYKFIHLWLIFLVVNISYYVYYLSGATAFLYEQTNIWFSANDVLHVLLIGWMAVIYFELKPLIVKERLDEY
jgi:hypothetical protein